MADQRRKTRNPRSRAAMLRRHRRAAMLTGAISAFLALGLVQLADAPKAKADEFDVVVDQALNAITGSLGDLAAGSVAIPELGAFSDAGAAAANPLDGWLQGLEQDWITSSFGQQVDTLINSWFNLFDPNSSACGLICDGAMGQGGGLLFGEAGVAAPPMSENLLVNPGFEVADPSQSGYSGVTVPGWTETGTPTVIAYGTHGGYPVAVASPLPKFFDFPQTPLAGGGDNFAGGGPVASSTLSQTIDLTGAAGTPFNLSADLGGQGFDPSEATVQVTFLDAHGNILGTDSLQPVTVWDRLGLTAFEQRDISGIIPEGTTSAQVTTIFTDNDHFLSNYNGAYADNESFTVGDPSLTAATLTPPTSEVGHLDHVFLIYMENKGAGDIVASPNAPYINSLISNYGYAYNYYALGHPSDPNYIRIIGGSDFGIDYDPAISPDPNTYVIDAPSLMQEMDQAGISWAGYEQSMPYAGDLNTTKFSDFDPDELPFAYFHYVHDNPDPGYLGQHLLPLTQLSHDLNDPSTFPAFTWIAADEDHNMEGPATDNLTDFYRYLVGQLTDQQYNIATGDQFVQQQISAIENSPTWTDPNERDAIILTWDEDNNNLSLGIGNEGNNVSMIVIPNGGAVTYGGMESGPFTTGAHYDEYSVTATIEDALRNAPGTLAPLTDNDKYATPMNAFWR